MSNFLPQTIPLKDQTIILLLLSAFNERIQPQIGGHEEEKSKDQPTSPNERFCPPKVDSNTNLLDNQIKNGESVKKNGESHYGKFNGPLEKPKTANKAFGSISDFLLFFENRNPEIKEFSKKFQEMENLEKKDPVLSLRILNEDITPSVYKSFLKMEVELKNHGSSKPAVQENEQTQKLKNALSKFLQKKKIQKDPKTEYIQLFKKDFKSLEEFYKQILYAYTMTGFLYLRMNEYLRTENWVKLDDLLIYTYCIFKAYLWGPTKLAEVNSFEELKSKSENGKLTLYRRADFDQGSLDFYQLDKVKEFSWTGVTSTSLIESITRKFSSKQPDKKPVLIVIEVNFKNLQPENFNALYLAKLSKCPSEEEVALAPGSIFELLEISQDQQEVIMRLRLITNAKTLAQQGKFLHGMLQAVMGNGDELKIVCLKEKELSRAIKHCRGNQLVKKLEFHLCNFNELSVQVLLAVLPTMKNLISFTFNSVELGVHSGWVRINECLGKKKIKNLEIENSIYDFPEILSFFSRFKDLTSLENLKLSFGENARIDSGNIRTLFNLVNNLAPKCAFEFHLTNICEVIVKGLKKSNFKKHLANFLCQIEEDSRSIPEEYFIEFPSEDEFRNILAQQLKPQQHPENKIEEKGCTRGTALDLVGIKELFGYSFERNSKSLKRTLLEVLEEKFTSSSKKGDVNLNEHSLIVRDEEFKGADPTEKQPLKELSLSFEGCNMIRQWDLKSLGQDIQYLESLTTLKLNFNKCYGRMSLYSSPQSGITDNALEILSNNVIQQLKGLNRLDLSLDECYEITDKGLKNLAFQGIQHLHFLTALSLSFGVCQAITDQGLMRLTLEGITKIKSLEILHLNFDWCERITDKGLESLFQDDRGIQSLEFMSNLSLSFKGCTNITDEGLGLLSEKGLQNLKKSLNILSLNFDQCYQITDLGIKAIAQNLGSLTTLRLNFEACQEITNEGLNSFCFSKDQTALHLGFNDCSQITDFGLESLSKKIKHLESLKHLQLNFGDCRNITDNGLDFLCSQGIKHLQRLNTLHLNFELSEEENPRITDKGLKSLAYQIQNLLELTHLHLDFKESNITDEGVARLCRDGIQYLNKLINLHINFQGCKALTNEGLQTLIFQGILPGRESLKTLHLDLSHCVELSDVGLKSFWSKGVRNLSKLEKLYVKFEGCQKITNEGLEGLIDEGIRHLPFLAILDLRFFNCPMITYEQLLSIKYQINLLGIPQLQVSFGGALEGENCEYSFLQGPSAASVLCQGRLGFLSECCPNLRETITQNPENPVEDLTLRLPQNFKAKSPEDLFRHIPVQLDVCLTDLDLSRSILSEGKMKTLKDLKTLHLNFDQCAMITDFTLHNLCLDGLKHFELLTTLHLSFKMCTQITDFGLHVLGCQGLKQLKKLVNLSLNFEYCYYITDKGLEILKEIQHPEQLNELQLSFRGCTNVGDKGIVNLCPTGIRRLKSLISLSLNFDMCQKITNRGLKKLYISGLKHLESLKSMHLSFQDCRQITKKGLKSLCRISTQPLISFFIDLGGVQIPERLKQQLFRSSSDSFILIRKNESSCKIEKSKLRRQNLGIQKDFGTAKSDEKPPGKIIANRLFFQYIGRSFYLLNIHTFPKFERLSEERHMD